MISLEKPMISLQTVNRAICALYQKALNAAGTGAELVAEDVSKPIIRPSGKVELEDGSDTRLLASGRERTVTFRLYYFAKDRERPKLENLAVRGAIGEAFLDGITVEDTYLGIDEGVSFTVTDGVLVASLELTLTEPVPEADAEPMEELNLDLEVTCNGCNTAENSGHIYTAGHIVHPAVRPGDRCADRAGRHRRDRKDVFPVRRRHPGE